MSLNNSLLRKTRRARELAKFLYLQRIKGFEAPGIPELDDDTLARLTEELRRSGAYLEFGSGGSTLLADRMGIPTTSVESDRYYASVVRRSLSGNAVVNLVTPRLGVTGPWGWPLLSSIRKGLRYAMAPFPAEPFPGLIFVDGRFRAACSLESARRAYEAGATSILMVDDYEDRPQYHHIERFLGPPERVGRSAVFRIGDKPVSSTAVEEAAGDTW